MKFDAIMLLNVEGQGRHAIIERDFDAMVERAESLLTFLSFPGTRRPGMENVDVRALLKAALEPTSEESGMYFSSTEEANEWLEFDADEETREQRAYAEPDRFEEWRRWKDGWEEPKDV